MKPAVSAHSIRSFQSSELTFAAEVWRSPAAEARRTYCKAFSGEQTPRSVRFSEVAARRQIYFRKISFLFG
jgi:hypothetical protein